MASNIIIKSPDTDVAVLFCYHYFNSLRGSLSCWFKTGTGNKNRFIPIHTICDRLGESLCNILPAFHCLTGCDSVSSFACIGKKKAFQVLCKKKEKLEDPLIFGASPDIDEYNHGCNTALMLIIFLYGGTDNDINIDQLRYKLFSQKIFQRSKIATNI